MFESDSPRDSRSTVNSRYIGILALLAFALGVYARFRALDSAPLAIDEYFIARSVENILAHGGLPAFDCGGFYTRGLLLQYLAAPLVLLGVSLAEAPRIIAASSSLVALPAAYIIGRRLGGPALGWIAIILLSLSLWSVEIARFGRMYAPFQAVFLWYVVCFLSRVVDGRRRAGYAMAALTLVAVLIWEGGVLLALTNALPFLLPQGRRRLRDDWIEILLFLLVLVLSYALIAVDFRALTGPPALPADYDDSLPDGPYDALRVVVPLWVYLRTHVSWQIALLVPLVPTCLALRALASYSQSFATRVLLLVMLCAAAIHQFAAAAVVLLLAWLMGLVAATDIRSRPARLAYIAIATWFGYWLCLSFRIYPSATETSGQRLLHVIYPLVQHPDVLGQILRPWIGSDPVLFVTCVALLSLAIQQLSSGAAFVLSDFRSVLILFFCLLFAAAAGDAPRHETRYVFFLFPLALLMSTAALQAWLRAPFRSGLSRTAALMVFIGALLVSRDFRIVQLLHVGDPDSAFRFDLPPAQQAHMVIREDSPRLAAWLRVNAVPQDVVVSAFQSLDYYYPGLAYFYVARTDFNFASYACRAGTRDRWSNRPLLQSTAEIAALTESHGRTFLVTYSDRVTEMRAALASYQPEVVWQRGHLAVLRLTAPSASQGG